MIRSSNSRSGLNNARVLKQTTTTPLTNTTCMSLTTSSPPKFEQYRTPSGITATPPHKVYRCSPLYPMLTPGRPKPALSRNPVQRVLQSESTSTPREVRIMPGECQAGGCAIPTAACRWKKETLDLLNATYDPDSVTPFKFGELAKLPSELQDGIPPQ